MKKYIIPVLALLTVGCTKDFETFNKNPYGATDEQLSRIPQGGNELVALQKLVVPQQENSYQMCFDLPATPYSGYAAQPKFQADYPVYRMDRLCIRRHLYQAPISRLFRPKKLFQRRYEQILFCLGNCIARSYYSLAY